MRAERYHATVHSLQINSQEHLFVHENNIIKKKWTLKIIKKYMYIVYKFKNVQINNKARKYSYRSVAQLTFNTNRVPSYIAK